jgi:hypothetical protein
MVLSWRSGFGRQNAIALILQAGYLFDQIKNLGAEGIIRHSEFDLGLPKFTLMLGCELIVVVRPQVCPGTDEILDVLMHERFCHRPLDDGCQST